jgi:hypothetical protein
MLRGYSLLAAIVNDLLRLRARRGSLRLAASATRRTMLASDIHRQRNRGDNPPQIHIFTAYRAEEFYA